MVVKEQIDAVQLALSPVQESNQGKEETTQEGTHLPILEKKLFQCILLMSFFVERKSYASS
jgi:hypothetical protein